MQYSFLSGDCLDVFLVPVFDGFDEDDVGEGLGSYIHTYSYYLRTKTYNTLRSRVFFTPPVFREGNREIDSAR